MGHGEGPGEGQRERMEEEWGDGFCRRLDSLVEIVSQEFVCPRTSLWDRCKSPSLGCGLTEVRSACA